MSIRPLATILIAVAALSGCKKYELEKESTQSFSNGYAEAMTVNIYQSRDDYANNRNPWKQLNMQPGGTAAVSMEIGKQHYVDWYNADYTLTNWTSGSGAIAPNTVVSPGETPRTYQLHELQSGNASTYDGRPCILPGNATSSTWRVVGIYNGFGNPLATAPFVQITYHKDYRAELSYDDPWDNRVEKRGFFAFSNAGFTPQSVILSMYDDAGTYQANCQYNIGGSIFPTSRDTFDCDLYGYSGSVLYDCVLVRQ